MHFSLLFFSQMEQSGVGNPYEMVISASRYADENAFEAVWIPERHFSAVGDIYPDPAVIAAALAPLTRRIRLRAGSVVLPLHHPLSVAERWAAVDRLSEGRVDIAFASGWNVNDFVLAPDAYERRRDEWIERIPVVRSLWRGEAQSFLNGTGERAPIVSYPRPMQAELNVWLAITRLTESFRIAGTLGYNVLTMLSGVTVAQLASNIAIYRKAREAAGLDPHKGVVTVMLHTYVHQDVRTVRDRVREPLMHYLRSTARTHVEGGALATERATSEREIDRIAEYSFERYFSGAALFGDVDSTQKIVSRFEAAGVNEIAAMVDFGLSTSEVMEGLVYLNDLKSACQRGDAARALNQELEHVRG